MRAIQNQPFYVQVDQMQTIETEGAEKHMGDNVAVFYTRWHSDSKW